jgi:hypothetical protein
MHKTSNFRRRVKNRVKEMRGKKDKSNKSLFFFYKIILKAKVPTYRQESNKVRWHYHVHPRIKTCSGTTCHSTVKRVTHHCTGKL